MIKVVDDFIPLEYQKNLKDLFLGKKFPWYYMSEITIEGVDYGRSGFYHMFNNEEGILSAHYGLISPLAGIACGMVGRPFHEIIRSRVFLQVPLNLDDYHPDPIHVDLPHTPHLVLLYYVCDNEAETIILENVKHDWTELKHGGTGMPNEEDITHRIKPKQGRAIIFDGDIYHTAMQPKTGVRCNLNMNIRTYPER